MKKVIIGLFLSVVALFVNAQEFPNKPVTLIVPYGPGGPIDVMARRIAMPLAKELGQPVIVENRPSTGGILAMELIRQAKPDGYTIVVHNNGMATVNGFSRNFKFDVLTDFSPIGEIAEVPMVLVGRRTLKPTNFAELRKYMIDNQQTINIASGGIGTPSHLCALALIEQLHIDAHIIPYKGAAPALTDLEAGQVDVMCDQITVTQQPIQSGMIKAYGAATLKRIPTMPDLPTLNEQGLRGFEQKVWGVLQTTKNTPPEVIDRLVRALQRSVKDPEYQNGLKALGSAAVSPDRATPGRVLQDLKYEQQKWQPLVLKDRVKNEK